MYEEDGSGYFFYTEIGDYEYVHPTEKMGEMVISMTINLFKNHFEFLKEQGKFPQNPQISNIAVETSARKQALAQWDKVLREIHSQILPEGLIDVLEMAKKKKQFKALNGLYLTESQLTSLIVQACERFGYLYSMYSVEYSPAGLDENRMPTISYKEKDNSISKIGATNLSDGQIRVAIDDRIVRLMRFLDKGDIWHCFFYSYKSISGRESINKETFPHMHFISHTWGLKRDDVLKQLRSKEYRLPAMPHIGFELRRNMQSDN